MGASIDFALILARPLLIVGLVIAIIAVKFAVLFGLGRAFRLSLDQNLLLAFALPQVGEFAFVLFSFATQQGVLDATITSPLVAAAALSMALTPLLLLVNERLVQPRFGTPERAAGEPDVIEGHGRVIIAGFGQFGSTVGRLLRANGVHATVLDIDSDRVDLLRRMGMQVYYGDASRHDLLRSAGAEEARLLVLALDTPERTLELVHTAKTHFPHLTIMARAFEWDDAHDLIEAGVEHVYRESLDTAVRVGAEALHLLGARAYTAHRAAQKFRHYDEEALRDLTARRRAGGTTYLSAIRQRIEELERIMLADRAEPDLNRDAGWDPETLRDEVRRVAAPAPGD